jgi:hypothetical protein
MSTMAMSTRIGRTGVSKRVLGRTAMRQLRGTSARSLQLQLHARMPSARGRIAVTQSRRARSPSPTTTGHAAEQLKASSLRVNAHTPKVVHTDFLVRPPLTFPFLRALRCRTGVRRVPEIFGFRSQKGEVQHAHIHSNPPSPEVAVSCVR